MLQRVKEILGSHVIGTDGDVGKIKDLFFDDRTLQVRYFVVDTGSWLNSREVLLIPSYFKDSQFPAMQLRVNLTCKQVENSPPVYSDMPLSRQYEESLHSYFGWAPYWTVPYYPVPGLYSYPMSAVGATAASPYATDQSDLPKEVELNLYRDADPNLHSFKEIRGYHLAATDGEIGHIADFLMDMREARLTHMIADTRNWLPGEHVVIDAAMLGEIDWEKQTIAVQMNREEIKEAPTYDPHAVIDEILQRRLSEYYHSRHQSRDHGAATAPRRSEEPPHAEQ
jgi:uncharacterized protein YrrD